MATILLQAGRGGGLTEAFSGQAQSVLGTQAPTILKKATTISAILFLVLSLVLAMYTARRGRSLIQQGMKMPQGAVMPIAETSGSENAQDAAETVEAVATSADPEAV